MRHRSGLVPGRAILYRQPRVKITLRYSLCGSRSSGWLFPFSGDSKAPWIIISSVLRPALPQLPRPVEHAVNGPRGVRGLVLVQKRDVTESRRLGLQARIQFGVDRVRDNLLDGSADRHRTMATHE